MKNIHTQLLIVSFVHSTKLTINNGIKVIRKRKYDLEYYLTNFVYILNDVNKWSSLRFINKDAKCNHWKSIYNEFLKWSKDNIFEKAFQLLLSKEYFKLSKVRRNKKINLFIDATKINNKSGVEGITINGENKKKNVTSIIFINDHNNLPLSFVKQNIKRTLYNGRNTSTSEIKNVQNALNKITINIRDYIKCDIIADKGYITQEKFRVFNREIHITTPKKKNQKIRNTQREKALLKTLRAGELLIISFAYN